jgi:hypothetical protein
MSNNTHDTHILYGELVLSFNHMHSSILLLYKMMTYAI